MSTAPTPFAIPGASATTVSTPTPLPTPAPTQPPLPAPSAFDILGPLHMLLARLEPELNPYTPSTSSLPSESSATLAYKDVGTAVQFLKNRIRRAVAEVAGLEDMDRTVEEQEEEIRELEIRIRGQREVLKRLGKGAGGMVEG